MKKYFYITLLLGAATLQAAAQNKNLNPTVQVTNTYERRMVGAERPAQEVFVPDSLYRFDLDFDYGGFEKPYGGLENFNPYWTELELAARPSDSRKLYLKAGAGYNFAPVLDAAYSVKDTGRFKLGIMARNNSYLGMFHNIMPKPSEASLVKDGNAYTGYRVDSRLGADARVDWDRVRLNMNLFYEGVQSGNEQNAMLYLKSGKQYNGADFNVGVSSNYAPSMSPFTYDVRLGYAFGVATAKFFDEVKTVELGAKDFRTENNARLDMHGRYRLNRGSALDLAIKANGTFGMPKYSLDDYIGGVVTLVPQYFFNSESVHLGVGAALMLAGGKTGKVKMNNRSVFSIFPSLEFRWNAVQDKLDLYAEANADGKVFGEREKALKYQVWLFDENYSISKNYIVDAGLRGNIADQVSYDLKLGWERDDLLPLVGVKQTAFGPRAGLVYANLDNAFAAFRMKAEVNGFELDADVRYRYYFNPAANPVRPSALEARLKLGYNYINRLYVGAGAEYVSKSFAGDYTAPGFVNVTALAKWAFTSRLSVFLQGDNLACSTLQYVPLFARKGICITGGIVLNF